MSYQDSGSSTEEEEHTWYENIISDLQARNSMLNQQLTRYTERLSIAFGRLSSYRSELKILERQRNRCLALIQSQNERIRENDRLIYDQQIILREREPLLHTTDNYTSQQSITSQPNAQSDNECILCLENERIIAFVPCGHYISCQICSDIIMSTSHKTCPLCNAEITYTLRVFGV